jgi:hypothetical protein
MRIMTMRARRWSLQSSTERASRRQEAPSASNTEAESTPAATGEQQGAADEDSEAGRDARPEEPEKVYSKGHEIEVTGDPADGIWIQGPRACRKFADEHIDRFDGDQPVPRPAQSPMSRTPSRVATFSAPGAAPARSMPRAVAASRPRHAPAPVLGCTPCITVPTARRSG